MEFEGSCTQLDAVGLVVLKGLSLSASTRENHSSVFELTDTVHALIRTFFAARLMAANRKVFGTWIFRYCLIFMWC
ncbi:hypothetical protein NC651_027925 [Populus alba x Populus x berolinensis]|nr:hypothetical protein NC651_027925 [Populus alba x Populus x berolinensis]